MNFSRIPVTATRVTALLAMLGCMMPGNPLLADGSTRGRFDALAIRNARVVVKPGEVIEKGTILIRGGRIEKVGADVEIPYDAEIIEAEGLTAYPGFVDAGARIGVNAGDRKSKTGNEVETDITKGAMANSPEAWRNGLFSDFNSAEAVQISEKDMDAWRKAGFCAVHVIPPDALMAGTTAVVALSDDARRETLIKPRAALSAGWSLTTSTTYPRSLMGSMALLRQTLLDAQHYQVAWQTFDRTKNESARPAHDPALDALRPVLEGGMPAIFPATKMDEIDRAINFAGEFKIRPVILGGQRAYERLGPIKAAGAPVLLKIDFAEKPEPGKINAERLRALAALYNKEIPKELEEKAQKADKENKVPEARRAFEDRLKKWNDQASMPKTLRENKIAFAFATDGCKDPEAFRKNLLAMIESGLAPDDALSALTTEPARIFGLDPLLGTIENGRYANVALMDGDFAKKETKVRMVIADGRKFDYRDAKKDEDKEDEDKKDEDKEGDDEKKEEGMEDGKKDEKAGDKKDEKNEGKLADRSAETDEDRKPATNTGGNALIRGATVITASHGELENTDILIRDGRIARIGAGLDAPRDFTVIDGAGAWVMPGIIDCHSHLAISNGINEWTDSITAQCRIADVIRPDDVGVFRATAGGVTAANLLHGSANTIGGQRAVIQMIYNRPASELFFPGFPPGVKFALGENVTRNPIRFPNTRMGVEAVIRRAFREAQDYQRSWDDYNALSSGGRNRTVPPRRDLKLEALTEILAGTRFIHCHSYNADEIMMILETLREFGIKRLTLEHGLEAFKIAPEVAQFGAYVSTFADNWSYKLEAYDATPYNAALLNEAGVTAILNSDDDERVRRMFTEAAKLVRFGGMGFEDAIRTITLNPALALGIADQTGSIDEGKRADLALFNGHPLNAYSRCFMTLIDGGVVFERRGERGGPHPLAETTKRNIAAIQVEPEPHGVYAVTNARIHPVSRPVIERGTIVMIEGKIAEVGANAAIPGGARVVDVGGLDVYPGLIDAGSRLGLNEIAQLKVTQDAGESGEIQPDLKAAVAVKPDSEIIPVSRFTGLTSAVAAPTGGIIPGQSAMIQLAGWTPKEMAYVETLALQVNIPASAGSVDFSELFMEEADRKKVRTWEDQLRDVKRLFAEAREYARMTADAAKQKKPAPKYRAHLEALIPYVNQEKPVVFTADSAAQIIAALDLIKEIKVRAILRGCEDAWKVVDQIAEAKLPVIIGPVNALPNEPYDPYDAPYRNAAILHGKGIKFAFQSNHDSDARNLPFNAAAAVAYGLPADVALRALTLTTAEIFGIEGIVGSIDAGKRADLIITDGDPLQATTNVRLAFIGGRPVNVDENKHTELYLKYRKRI